MTASDEIGGTLTVEFPGASQQVVVYLGDGTDPLMLLDEMQPADMPELSPAQRLIAVTRMRYWADVLAGVDA